MNSALELSRQLIQIPSYSGVNNEAINLIENFLKNLGFSCEILNYSGDNSYEVNNLHAIFNPKKSAKTIYFAGHTDVVKEGDKTKWRFDPFSAKIDGDKLYGRGASDMKCAIASFMSAVAEYLSQNPNPDFGIGFLITNDEENDSVNGTVKVLKWMEQKNFNITYCLVGEPTNPNKLGEMIKIGRRGSIGFNIEIFGKQGHVAYPDIALNPITMLINLCKVLKDQKMDNGTEFFDPSNLEFTNIGTENLGSNVIPSKAFCAFNIRFNDTHKAQDIIDFVEYACKKTIGQKIQDTPNAIGKSSPIADFVGKYQMNYRLSGEAFLSKPKELAKITQNAVQKICGVVPVLGTTGGTSDARFIKDYAEVVEIGLVNETAHKIDEFSLISEIENLQKIYLEILREV
ncbi:MAG: succinyl-diaminopimelate desuccinylase [Alphaproteobacteria bacterium]